MVAGRRRGGRLRIGCLERIGLAAGFGPEPVVSASLPRWTGADAEAFLDRLVGQGAPRRQESLVPRLVIRESTGHIG